MQSIVVHGCQHSTVGPTIRGTFYKTGDNHGKPAYKRDVQVNGFDVMLYFWDDRDGPAFSGWWFGPAIGGDQVWAYHGAKQLTSPPKHGWKVPYDGPVDETLRIEAASGATNGAGAQQMSQQQQMQYQQQAGSNQHYMQQQQQQQMRMMQMQGKGQGGQQMMHPQQQMLMEQRRKQEEMQREAMQQQWMERQKQQLEAKRREQEEQHRLRMEEQQKRMAELRQKQEEDMARKRAENQAASGIRAAMHNLYYATKETLDDLKKAVDAELEKGLENCGSLKEKVQEDVKRALEQAHRRIEQLEEQKRKAEEDKKREEERKLAEEKRLAEVRAEACKKLEAISSLFDRFDKDGDQLLSKPEIKSYAKEVHSMDLVAEDLLQIEKVLFPGAKGVKKTDFQRLKVAIGVVKDKGINLKRRAAREAREKELATMRDELQAKVKEVDERIAGSGDGIADAEQKVSKKDRPPGAKDMMAQVDEIDKLLQESRERVQGIKKEIEEIKTNCDKDIQELATTETSQLELKVRPLDVRLNRIAAMSFSLRTAAKKRDMIELRALKKEALRIIRHHQQEERLSAEDLFAAFRPDDEKISESNFVGFFSSCKRPPAVKPKEPKEPADSKKEDAEEGTPEKPKAVEDLPTMELTDASLARLFKSLDYEELGYLPKDNFTRLVRLWVKVIKDTVATEAIEIDSAVIRRLTVGEVLEVLGFPEKEQSKGIVRAKCKMLKDEKEGFVTFEGVGGTTFLEESSIIFKVVKDTILTDSFDISGGSKDNARKLKDTTRKLKEGEEVEVLEWPKKEESADLMRLLCRAVSDGAVGWATSVGNSGIAFMHQVP